LGGDGRVRAAFLHESGAVVLAVVNGGERLGVTAPEGLSLQVVSVDAFLRQLVEAKEELEGFLALGTDLLGRRDDILWRHIDAAGFTVAKGEGVP